MSQGLRRAFPRHRLDPIVRLLARTGITPNAITWTGCILSGLAGVLVALDAVALGGWVSLLAGGLDMFDGALARATNRATRFGALLDSTLDRYSEALILGGVLLYAAAREDMTLTGLVFLTILGSLMVSYVKARAEGLGLTCDVGLFTRPERVVVLGLGLVTGWLLPAMLVMAVFTNFTAAQRVRHVQRQLSQTGEGG